MSTRLLIIGLDSAEPVLLKRWVDQGVLPSLAALMTSGQAVNIRNLPGFGNGVFWPTIATGVDPSYHGRYYRRQPQPPKYELDVFREEYFKREPFWAAMEREGLLVGVLDPIESPGAGLRNGIEVLEWLTHGRVERPRSSPPELIDKLIKRYGEDPFRGDSDAAIQRGLSIDGLSRAITQRIATKTAAALELLNQADWDTFFVSYHDPHDIGHQAWHVHEQSEEASAESSAKREQIEDPLKTTYRLLDEAISELQRTLAPGGDVVVLAGPGMERNVSGNHLLPDVLRAFQKKPRSRLTKLVSGALKTVMRSGVFSAQVQKQIKSVKSRTGVKFQRATGRPYFSVPHNVNAGAVRINMAGRDSHGIVEPGQMYEDLCADLTERLLRLRDANGDIPAVKEVVRTHQNYDGPELNSLPDLLVIWNREADLSGVSSPDIGALRASATSSRTGDHTDRGLIISGSSLPKMPLETLNPAQVTPLLVAAARHLSKRTESTDSAISHPT